VYAFFLAAISLMRVPDGGVQPQIATAGDGTVHLVYFGGPAAASDVVYRRSADGETWSGPVRVNAKPGAAIAAGTVRGPHIAVSPSGRVHVAWMGSSGMGKPAPLLDARLAPGARAFEPERNLIRTAWGLDGGALRCDALRKVLCAAGAVGDSHRDACDRERPRGVCAGARQPPHSDRNDRAQQARGTK
jgi:hypothetical protein